MGAHTILEYDATDGERFLNYRFSGPDFAVTGRHQTQVPALEQKSFRMQCSHAE